MLKGKRILALIPARGGSKGIKHKNIVPLNGKPLIAWTVEASLGSRYVDDTVITTDDEDIAWVGKCFGARVPFMRPAELAGDRSKTIEAVLHALAALSEQGNNYDVLVLLQPTSPLRDAEDIDGALEKFFDAGERSLVSVSPVEEAPLLIRSVSDECIMTPLLNLNSTCRRQDMPIYYRVNGSIYINSVSEVSIDTSFNDNSVPFIMKRTHSIDIDEQKDIIVAEYYMNNSEAAEELMTKRAMC